jgi:ubiquinone/menaquinone biosynthesis C-methylase UbiE
MENNKEIIEKPNFFYDPALYDLQINWPARLAKERQFFEDIISGRQVFRILDIGCGTGHHAQLFSEILSGLRRKGNVAGIDPAEDTINYAKRTVIKSENIELKVAGFENLDTLFSDGYFDLITCLGNTLPLLKNRKNVKSALKASRKKLAKGGLAIFQFLNFEPDVMERERFYRPKIFIMDGARYIFLKHFEYGKINTRADFLITELAKSDEITDFSLHSSYMCTLRKSLFEKMAYNSGFKKINLLAPGGTEAFDKKRHISLYAMLER